MRKRDKRNNQYGGISLMIVEVELGLEGDFPQCEVFQLSINLVAFVLLKDRMQSTGGWLLKGIQPNLEADIVYNRYFDKNRQVKENDENSVFLP